MEIAIYFEGGGDSAETKARLRQGMSAFLKPLVDMARQRRFHWKVVSCGGRSQACDAFLDALEKSPETCNILLVDSEDAVTSLPCQHLRQRDGWNLPSQQEDQIHLMVQCMETWLLADRDAMVDYYGQRFNTSALPRRSNLEEEPKQAILSAIDSATRLTQKGAYGKIKHASELLHRIDPAKVCARCPHCRRFFETISNKLQS